MEQWEHTFCKFITGDLQSLGDAGGVICANLFHSDIDAHFSFSNGKREFNSSMNQILFRDYVNDKEWDEAHWLLIHKTMLLEILPQVVHFQPVEPPLKDVGTVIKTGLKHKVHFMLKCGALAAQHGFDQDNNLQIPEHILKDLKKELRSFFKAIQFFEETYKAESKSTFQCFIKYQSHIKFQKC